MNKMRQLLAAVLVLGLLSGVVSADLANSTGKLGPVLGSSGGTSFTGGTVTTPILFADGTRALPSVSFANDPNTGIYKASSTTLDFSSDDVLMLSLSSGSYGIQLYSGNVAVGRVNSTSGFQNLANGSTAGFNFATTMGTPLTSFALETAQTPDTLVMGLPASSNSFLLAEYADRAFDFAHAATTDPTLFIHSHNQNTTEWVGLTHNGTDAVFTTGKGAMLFPAGTISSNGVALGAANTGFYVRSSAVVETVLGGTSRFAVFSDATAVNSAGQYTWSSGSLTASASDTGLSRNAAGVIRATDAGTSIRGFLGGGAAVASASALPVPTGSVFHVTGTNNIDSITSTNFASGACITMIFDGILTVGDANNLKLTAALVTTADDTLSLCYDGSNWYETARSVN